MPQAVLVLWTILLGGNGATITSHCPVCYIAPGRQVEILNGISKKWLEAGLRGCGQYRTYQSLR